MCSTLVAATSAIFLNRNFWKNTEQMIFWSLSSRKQLTLPVPLFGAGLLPCWYPGCWQVPQSLSASCWQPSPPATIIIMSCKRAEEQYIITLANVAHCFSISWAWDKFLGFSNTTDVDFSAVIIQGMSWRLRPQKRDLNLNIKQS